MRAETILTPAEIARLPKRDLRASLCVVFDVLRATSTMLTAFAHGARRIFPALTIEEAWQRQRDGWTDALLGGERGGVRIEGFQLGNSPGEYTREAVAGRTIITTTTNGTVALRACGGARETLAGAFLNLDALAAHFRTQADAAPHILLVCAGTGDRFALEDGLAAGALLARLAEGTTEVSCDDASLAMLALHREMGRDPLRALQAGENGRRLAEIGLAADVAWCAQTSVFTQLAVLRHGALEGR